MRLKAIPARGVEPICITLSLATHRAVLPVKLRHPQHFMRTHSESTGQCVEVVRETKSDQKLDHNLR